MPLGDACDGGGASFDREGDFQDAVSSSPGKKPRPVLKEEDIDCIYEDSKSNLEAAAAGSKASLDFGRDVQNGMHNDTHKDSHSTSQTLQAYADRLRATLLSLGGDSDLAGDDPQDP
ncbi:hypothetical protein Sste5346_009554 [Sporothrix stenoceras]|uniref:Uncharacterized protein n=1 Tax=Sporothrix stenoceras TaxID=5173 RepID=A0ABR3YJP1_9PEZI